MKTKSKNNSVAKHLITDKDPVSELGNLCVADPAGVVSQRSAQTASLRNLKSLILLTYYDDDVHIQTCDEKLLMTTLQGNVKLLFCNLRLRRRKKRKVFFCIRYEKHQNI